MIAPRMPTCYGGRESQEDSEKVITHDVGVVGREQALFVRIPEVATVADGDLLSREPGTVLSGAIISLERRPEGYEGTYGHRLWLPRVCSPAW